MTIDWADYGLTHPSTSADSAAAVIEAFEYLLRGDRRMGIDVREGGAQCDGGADDTADIQALQDDVGENSVLVFPDGTETIIEGTVTVPENFCWRGGGVTARTGSNQVSFQLPSVAIRKPAGTAPILQQLSVPSPGSFPQQGGKMTDLRLVAPRTAAKFTGHAGLLLDGVHMQVSYDGSADNAAFVNESSFWDWYQNSRFSVVGSSGAGAAVILRGLAVPDGISGTYLQFFKHSILNGGVIRYEQNVNLGGPLATQMSIEDCQWENANNQVEFVNNVGSPQSLGKVRMARGSSTDLGPAFTGALKIGAGWNEIDLTLEQADDGGYWPWLNSASDITQKVRLTGNPNYSTSINRGAGAVQAYQLDRSERLLGLDLVGYDDGGNVATPLRIFDQFGLMFQAIKDVSGGGGGLSYHGIQIGSLRIFVGTGPPDNTHCADGDFFLRLNGGGAGSTHIYFKNAGAWIGIA